MFSPGKVSKYLNKPVLKSDDFGHDLDLLTWYGLSKKHIASFQIKVSYPVLIKNLILDNVFSLSYILNDKYILSVITDAKPHALNISYLQKIDFRESAED